MIINRVGQYRQAGRSWYQRNVNTITKITVHHTASRQTGSDDTALTNAFNAHKNNGWPGLSYHFFIPKSGKIYQINNFADVTWHDTVNWDSIGVCLEGYFHPDVNENPSPEQIKSLRLLLDKLCTEHPEFPADQDDVVSHRDRSATACPGNNLFPKIDEYRTMKGNVQWGKEDSDSFGTLVKKATQWDETCKEYELGDPNHTMFDKLKSFVAGLRSRISDIQTKLATAEAEVTNRTDQVSRLKTQLLDEQKLRKDLQNTLTKSLEEHGGIVKVYEDRISVMQGQIDNRSKEVGKLTTELAQCQAGNDTARKNLIQRVTDFINSIWK